MAEVMSVQRKKIHPHKFTLWIALGSIIMMFAGLTSAYIVKRDQPGWVPIELPRVFWYSTAVILVSSLTMQMAVRAFKDRAMSQYRILITLTAALGLAFILLQAIGYMSFEATGNKIDWTRIECFEFFYTGHRRITRSARAGRCNCTAGNVFQGLQHQQPEL